MLQTECYTHPDIYNLVRPSPIRTIELEAAPQVSTFIKDETMQPNGSFKIRGPFNKVLHLSEQFADRLSHGIVTASAGNHAQGTAMAGNYMDVPVHVYLPHGTAKAKTDALEALGANITYVAGSVDDALDVATEYAASKDLFFIHPFDDEDIIDGNSGVGVEIAGDERVFESVFVPVGGGGLLSGVCRGLQVKSPDTKVFGVQLAGCDSFTRSVTAHKVIELAAVNDLADGTAVRRAGAITLRHVLASPSFGGMLSVSNGELYDALEKLEASTGIRAETAAGLSLAGMNKFLSQRKSASGNYLALITGRHRDPVRFEKLATS